LLDTHQDVETVVEFKNSPGFISGFKERNRVSSRPAHLKCYPTLALDDKIKWVMRLSSLLSDVPEHERIINVDESCERVHPGGRRTWAPTSAQNSA
jgi:hypothetical protein